MTIPRQTVGVIDIGSNSIKLLVASRGDGGEIIPILQTTDETRIGDGISRDRPRLREASMEAACRSVKRLAAKARSAGADSIAATATSAVRDAVNRGQFSERLARVTGLELRILTGREEAELIGLGIRCDPALGSPNDFYLFDLGGGSLEMITIRNGRTEQAVSLPLGCLRLTERFVSNPEAPFRVEDQERIEAHTREVIASSRFAFDLPPEALVVVTGGTAAIACVLRERQNHAPAPAALSRKDLKDLLSLLGPLPLTQRRRVPGLPPKRADVFPTALATLLAVLRLGDLDRSRQSSYNLRFGLASRLLEMKSPPGTLS